MADQNVKEMSQPESTMSYVGRSLIFVDFVLFQMKTILPPSLTIAIFLCLMIMNMKTYLQVIKTTGIMLTRTHRAPVSGIQQVFNTFYK